jgi:hypothetical protein
MNPTQEVAGQRPEGNAIDVGPASLRISGYIGLTGIYRSTSSGGSPGTSFATIPYEDTVRGNVSEARLTAQASRITLRVDADFPEERPRFRSLSGYFEMDFNGSTPGTIAVTSTSAGFRLRHAFGEARYGEGDTFLIGAGQAFTLMTPAKAQLSIWPSDVEMSQAIDTNYLAGMVWGRIPQFRMTWRPSPAFNWAASVENPEQQLGRSLVTLPSCCAGDIEAQYNTGSDELNTPNLMPDVVTRVAFNPSEAVHVDAGGVLRAFRHTTEPYEEDFSELGGGVNVNAGINATSATRLIAQFSFGSGMGRYIGGLVPDVAFRSDGSIDLIETTSWVAGLEQRLSPELTLATYYSGVEADSSVAIDTDGRYIGYGFPGSSNSNNKTIKEWTVTGAYRVIRTTDRGSVQVGVQTSWLEREPWSHGSGLESADAFMFMAQLRYNLP